MTGELRHSESLAREGLARNEDDDPRRLVAECRNRGSTGAQLLAHRIGGGALTVSVGVVHGGARDIGHRQVPDFGDLETGAVELVPGARGNALLRRDVVYRTSAWFAAGLSLVEVVDVLVVVTLGDRRRRSSSKFPDEPSSLPAEQQENDTRGTTAPSPWPAGEAPKSRGHAHSSSPL